MKLYVNSYGLKLFVLAPIIFCFLYITQYSFNINYFTYNGIIILLIFDIVLSISSLFIVEEINPVAYYLIWYWSSVSYLLYPYITNHILNKSLVALVIIPVISSLIFGTILLVAGWVAVRIFLKGDLQSANNSSYLKIYGSQNLRGSVMFSFLVYLDIFGYRYEMFTFLKPDIFIPLLIVSYFAAFINIYYLNYQGAGINGGIIFLFLISVLPFIEYHWPPLSLHIGILMLIMILSSIIIFLIGFKVGRDRSTGQVTGGVVSSYRLYYYAIIALAIVWVIGNTFLNIKGLMNYSSLLLIILPISIGSFASDNYHGHIADKIYKSQNSGLSQNLVINGTIGGVGMSDGLWFAPVLVIIIYILTQNYNVLMALL